MSCHPGWKSAHHSKPKARPLTQTSQRAGLFITPARGGMTKQNERIMKQTKHVLSAVTKPCGGRFRVTILADGWVINRYITCLPVVYALVLNPTQAEGIAEMTAWVRFLRHAAVSYEKARNADPRALAKIARSKRPCKN